MYQIGHSERVLTSDEKDDVHDSAEQRGDALVYDDVIPMPVRVLLVQSFVQHRCKGWLDPWLGRSTTVQLSHEL